MSPIPASGETSPPAANPEAPSKAEAAPACSLPASMARVLDDVKVSPSIARRKSSSISYRQKLQPRHIAAHSSTETAAIPTLPVTKGPKAVSIPRNMRMNILLFFSIFVLSSNPDAKVPLFISREMSISV